MDKLKSYIPTFIRAMIYNLVFSSFRGKRGMIAIVVLLVLYFALNQFDIINF